MKLNKHKGLGDTIAAATDFLGIPKHSGCGCQQRQEWLNKKIPYSSNSEYKNTENKK